MLLNWVAEPFDDCPSLPEVLGEAAEQAVAEGAARAWVAVAWMRQDGLSAMAEPLKAIADAGCVQMLVGREFGETTQDAVAEALRLGADLHLFYDPKTTFHPKVYLVCSATTAWLLVGSQNLTKGGVRENFEASLYLRCPVATPIITQVQSWFERLAAPGRACQVTLETLPEMHLPTEAQRRSRRGEQGRERAAAGDDDSWQASFSTPPMPGLRGGGGDSTGSAGSSGRATDGTSGSDTSPGGGSTSGGDGSTRPAPAGGSLREAMKELLQEMGAYEATTGSGKPSWNIVTASAEYELCRLHRAPVDAFAVRIGDRKNEQFQDVLRPWHPQLTRRHDGEKFWKFEVRTVEDLARARPFLQDVRRATEHLG